ncbi:MAG: WS/DGAT domain-containing protein [Acidimicrobiia bacterium]|nr:WS/DGAT domain-containing protein [Acidimicrobiia bacterium]
MADQGARSSRFERQMSPAEALMWNVEKDPWLNPSGASLSIIDGPVDGDQFERWLRAAVAALPRLRERVVPGIGRYERPSWNADPEFDFGYHYRHVDLAGDRSERELLDYVALAMQEPYDRTRPLWQVTLIGGLDGDRSGLLMKLHHSIADGYGMARMQERFMVRDVDAPVPDEVDLDALVAETCAEEAATGGSGGLTERALDLATAPPKLTRRIMARAALAGADPSVWLDTAESVQRYARMIGSQVRPSGEGDSSSAGSPLWTGRSRHRHLEMVRVSLSGVKAAAKALDASVNDVFMTGLINGAVAHHDARDQPAEAFNTSFVVSTRTDSAEGGNSFTPVRVQVPATPMSTVERLRAVQERVERQRSSVHGGGMMGGLAGLVNLLPTSLTTSTARSQAARIDFATTNVRSTTKQLYIAGHKMTEIFAPGPVAGSAMIVAVLSYLDTMHLMLTIDPCAITEPGALRADIERAYDDLLNAA